MKGPELVRRVAESQGQALGLIVAGLDDVDAAQVIGNAGTAYMIAAGAELVEHRRRLAAAAAGDGDPL